MKASELVALLENGEVLQISGDKIRMMGKFIQMDFGEGWQTQTNFNLVSLIMFAHKFKVVENYDSSITDHPAFSHSD